MSKSPDITPDPVSRTGRHRADTPADVTGDRETKATTATSSGPGSTNTSRRDEIGSTATEGELTGKGRTVLVTGASGMLGGEVARTLLEKGWRVRVFQRGHAAVANREGVDEVLGSVTDPDAVAKALEGVDDVVHLAAKVSFAGDWEDFVHVNITGTRVLLTVAQELGVQNVVFVSSPSVAHAGTSIEGVGAEPANPRTARGNYARSKAAAELLALETDGRGLRVAAIRPHIVWGPGDTQLVERIVDRAAAGRLPNLDHGAAMIDTTYIDNASEAIARCLERIDFTHGKAIVVTNGEPRPVGELVARMCAAAGVDAPTRSVPGKVARVAGKVIEKVWPHIPAKLRGHDSEPPMTEFLAEQMSTAHWFDQKETHELLNWKPSVSLDDGMQRLSQHYKDHPRPERNTGSVAAERVLEVADDQRVRAERAADAAGSGRSDTMNDLQNVRSK